MNEEFKGAVAAAAQLFENSDEEDVAAVYIVGGRPNFADIRSLEGQASGLVITIDQFGDICLRRSGRKVATPRIEPAKTGSCSVDRLIHHVVAWNAGFAGLSDGVR
jgi:hypothetical protein